METLGVNVSLLRCECLLVFLPFQKIVHVEECTPGQLQPMWLQVRQLGPAMNGTSSKSQALCWLFAEIFFLDLSPDIPRDYHWSEVYLPKNIEHQKFNTAYSAAKFDIFKSKFNFLDGKCITQIYCPSVSSRTQPPAPNLLGPGHWFANSWYCLLSGSQNFCRLISTDTIHKGQHV